MTDLINLNDCSFMGMCIEASLKSIDDRMYIFSSQTRVLIYTRKMVLTGYLLLTCKFQQVVRRESKWAKRQMTLNTLHLRLRDIRVCKEGQKNLTTQLMILCFF